MAARLLGVGTLLAFSFAASQPGDAQATGPADQWNQIKNGDRSPWGGADPHEQTS